MADTLIHPGSDSGVVRIHGTNKAVAFTSDVSQGTVRQIHLKVASKR